MVPVFDEQENVIVTKPRSEIDKKNDIVYCVDVVVIRPNGHLILSKIPEGKLYKGQLASTAATMLRSEEEPLEAAKRGLKKELGLNDAKPQYLGKEFFTFPDGVKRFKSTFKLVFEGDLKPNPEDVEELVEFSPEAIDEMLKNGDQTLAPTFAAIWDRYKDHLGPKNELELM